MNRFYQGEPAGFNDGDSYYGTESEHQLEVDLETWSRFYDDSMLPLMTNCIECGEQFEAENDSDCVCKLCRGGNE